MKCSTNEITGANLVSKSSNQEAYAEGYDRIFGKKKEEPVLKSMTEDLTGKVFGILKVISFSGYIGHNNKYGYDEAFKLACEYRKEQIKRLNSLGYGYAELHGL